MPFVTVRMLAGRTDEQKKALIEKVTDAVCETANVPPERVHVFIDELEKEHYGQGGKRLID